MFGSVIKKLNGKDILILGFGREGRSTLRFIQKYVTCRSVTVADAAKIDPSGWEGVSFLCGEEYQSSLRRYDVILKSPGIVLLDKSEEVLRKLSSQTQLFLECFRDQTIGITGTKGKSTTTTLIYHILKSGGVDALLVGNIGIPAFDRIDKITKKTVIVYELSCHQLEYVNVSPHIALLLNLYEDHLDHYGSVREYHGAKERIYRFQNKGDLFLCNAACEKQLAEAAAETVTLSDRCGVSDVGICGYTIHYYDKSLILKETDTTLVGNHNFFDIAAAYTVTKLFSISDAKFKTALFDYRALPHRLEYFETVNGVKYYDDSISTVCQTTIQALIALKHVGTVIIGGMDRGIDYGELAEFLSIYYVDNIVLMPDTGFRIGGMIEEKCRAKGSYCHCIYVGDLREAVEVAVQQTPKGKSCLLSPAAASYGFFKNFEERGAVFKELVRSYMTTD